MSSGTLLLAAEFAASSPVPEALGDLQLSPLPAGGQQRGRRLVGPGLAGDRDGGTTCPLHGICMEHIEVI